MTTPAYFPTGDRLIKMAYMDAGLLQQGDDPNGEQIADGVQRMNDMINLWQTQGLKLWLYEDYPITLIAGQGTYSLYPGGDVDMTKPMRGLQGYYRDTNGIRRPLTILSWDDYMRLSQINQEGQINSYFVNKLYDRLDIFFWLLPDSTAATGTGHILLQKQVPNFIGVTDTTIFPQEWFIALRWGLADDLATGQPQAIMDRCAQRAMLYRTALEDWDVEDAPTNFQPDQRSAYFNTRFR
jgi:hypothetical protein